MRTTWETTERTLTLTNEQWCTLAAYIAMTAKVRERERKLWEEMVNDKAPDGTPMFLHAAQNAQYYEKLETTLEEIRKRIERRE